MRKYRIVSGISYPRLFTGPNQSREIKAGIDQETRGYYHDESIKLNGDDVRGFVGKPICLEHDESVQVGKITAAWQDRDNHMRITARIWTDTPLGEEVFQRINNGNLRGFSVGYDVSCARDNPNQVVAKHFNEISVCEEPFFEGASITVAATKKGDYKSDAAPRVLNFKIMAEQKNTAEEAVPLEQANKDSSEIARAHDEVIRKTEQMEAELAALREAQKQKDEELARFRQEREAQRTQYGEDNKPLLEEVLEINKEQYKAEHGEAAELPEDYVASTTAAFMAPEAARVIAPIVASARAWKKNRDASKAQEQRLAEMEEKLKKMSEDQTIAEAHVRASSRRLELATGQHQDTTDDRRLAVTASDKLDVKNLFVPQQPNEQERALAQLNYGQTLPVSVTASGSGAKELAPVPDLPKNLATSVPNSMRYSQNGKYLFHHLVCNNRPFGAVAPLDMKKETEMLNH